MTITALPIPPSRQDPANFSERADAFMAALPAFATETNATAVDVDADAVAAAASAVDAAVSATAANASANVSKWVSGTTYAQGDVEWSPINFFSYRRKVAGAGTTDPSADPTNWALVSGAGDVSLAGVQTLSNKTLTSPIINTPTINTPTINTPTINTPTINTPVINSINGGQLAGMRNRIINGGMQIAQRSNVGISSGFIGYVGADRWLLYVDGSVSVGGLGQFLISGFNSGMGQGFSNVTGTLTPTFVQRIESANCRDLGGKLITVSGKIFQDTGISQTFNVSVNGATQLNNFTAVNLLGNNSIACPSGVTPFSFQYTLAAGAADNGIDLTIKTAGNITVAGKGIFIGDCQLELGSVATPFEHRPYGMELALCQRYYEKTQVTVGASVLYPAAAAWLSWKVTKRANPTVTTSPDSGSGGAYTAFGADGAYQSSTNSVGAGATVTATAEL